MLSTEGTSDLHLYNLKQRVSVIMSKEAQNTTRGFLLVCCKVVSQHESEICLLVGESFSVWCRDSHTRYVWVSSFEEKTGWLVRLSFAFCHLMYTSVKLWPSFVNIPQEWELWHMSLSETYLNIMNPSYVSFIICFIRYHEIFSREN